MNKKVKDENKTDNDNLIKAIEKLSLKMDASGLCNYIEDSRHPFRIIWRNLLAGIARGVGLTLGATLIVAVIIKVIYGLIQLNIPYITEMLKEIVLMIKNV